MHKLISIVCGLILAAPVYASVENTCTGNASDTDKCLYYFKGYLHGLSEAGQVNGLAADNRGSETFMQRALRTRLGVEKARWSESSSTVNYCLPEQASLVTIARQLQDTLAADTEKWNRESDPILAAIQHTFPC